MNVETFKLALEWVIANGPQLIGVVMPLLVEYINKDIPVNQDKIRFSMTFIACLLAAIILKWNELVTGSPESVILSAGLIFTESQIVFKLYFKESWLRSKMVNFVGGEVVNTSEPPTETEQILVG